MVLYVKIVYFLVYNVKVNITVIVVKIIIYLKIKDVFVMIINMMMENFVKIVNFLVYNVKINLFV